MRIAINQPYFIPYAGFFRLLSAADVFVVYDDVQYSSQSWVNRNRLTNVWGEKNWLTIPLKNYPLGTKIHDLEFAEDIETKWQRALSRFPAFGENRLVQELNRLPQYGNPRASIVQTLRIAARMLGINVEIVHSSLKNISPESRGSDRVIAICEHFGAKQYINAPGGVHLYRGKDFEKKGIELKILASYENKTSILERLAIEDPKDIRREIDAQTKFIS